MSHLIPQEMYLGREGQSPLELRRTDFSLDYVFYLHIYFGMFYLHLRQWQCVSEKAYRIYVFFLKAQKIYVAYLLFLLVGSQLNANRLCDI